MTPDLEPEDDAPQRGKKNPTKKAKATPKARPAVSAGKRTKQAADSDEEEEEEDSKPVRKSCRRGAKDADSEDDEAPKPKKAQAKKKALEEEPKKKKAPTEEEPKKSRGKKTKDADSDPDTQTPKPSGPVSSGGRSIQTEYYNHPYVSKMPAHASVTWCLVRDTCFCVCEMYLSVSDLRIAISLIGLSMWSQ